MPIPPARPGLVFRYEYLWKSQALASRQNAEKDRPACIVLAVTRQSGDSRVLIVPITTQPPPAQLPAIEIPPKVIAHLGLDGARRSWIILSEANVDCWPSPDMRQIPGNPSRFEYGLLPLALTNMLRSRVAEAVKAARIGLVDRDLAP